MEKNKPEQACVEWQHSGHKEQWSSLGANNWDPCQPPLTRSQNPALKQSKMSMEKSHWRLQLLYWPNQPSGKTWADHCNQVANRTLWPASTPQVNWHHGLCTLRLQRSGTDGPSHLPGLFYLVATETPIMAAGWVNHQQAVGNGGRPAPHHPISGNMWTEGLSRADSLQKKTTHGWQKSKRGNV